jgi:hypothetical protein
MSRDEAGTMTRTEVFEALRALKVASAVVAFGGGNDSGGVESITFLDATGAEMGALQEYYGYGSGNRPSSTKLHSDGALAEALGKPVYDKYYSFAGDFQVDGTVTWNVSEGTVRMTGTESVSHDEEFADDL